MSYGFLFVCFVFYLICHFWNIPNELTLNLNKSREAIEQSMINPT